MIAVIFEAIPQPGQWDRYLELAAALRPQLQTMQGFISIERYQSLSNEGKVLSLSFWEDEASVARWRNVELHRQAQSEGRSTVFKDYRIRIAHVVRDYGLDQRDAAPHDSKLIHHQQTNSNAGY